MHRRVGDAARSDLSQEQVLLGNHSGQVRHGVMVNPASHTKFLTEPLGQGRPPVLRPRLDVCSNHVGIGFVRNFIAHEFG
jgi:hypothetical protein